MCIKPGMAQAFKEGRDKGISFEEYGTIVERARGMRCENDQRTHGGITALTIITSVTDTGHRSGQKEKSVLRFFLLMR